MTLTPRHGGGVILITLLAALVLSTLPLPDWAVEFRPEWPLLVLIYWSIALPHRVGIGAFWIAGLLIDTLRGALLGQHALAYTLVGYICLRMHRIVRVYPLWQQALGVLALLILEQWLLMWIRGLIGQTVSGWAVLMPALTSTLLWPWLFVILRDLRRRFRVT
jgi:rod shape-determining protein MreD